MNCTLLKDLYNAQCDSVDRSTLCVKVLGTLKSAGGSVGTLMNDASESADLFQLFNTICSGFTVCGQSFADYFDCKI